MYPYPVKYNWGKYTILIVEDDYSSALYLKEVLKGSGIKIVIAYDGQSAVEICKNNSTINLVLMDIELPLMNGFDSTIEIKKLRSEIPVIAETAYASPQDLEKCLLAGCNDFITKPIDSIELLEKISKYLS